MSRQHVIRCENCGTEWAVEEHVYTADEVAALEDVCPVCHFRVASVAMPALAAMQSTRDLELRLSALISEARTSGLDDASIVDTLRDELEFIAELAHAGRNLSVQIIDLGPQDSDLAQRPLRDRRDILQTRSVGR